MTTQELKLSKTNSLLIKRRSSLSNHDPSLQSMRNSISKGVKYGEISFITKRQSERGNQEPHENVVKQKTQQAFEEIRKKYDKLKNETTLKEKSIEKAKQALKRAKQEQKIYLDKRNQAVSVSSQLESKAVQIKQLLQQSQMSKKSFLTILTRLKDDIVFFQNKGSSLADKSKQLKRLLKSCSITDTNTNAQSLRTKALLDLLKYELGSQNQRMQEHLQSLRQKLQQIKTTTMLFEIRDNQVKQIAERAIQDKDQNQKWWRKALLTNKLVKRFLEIKMDTELDKFNVVETAFKNIKIATGVVDGPTMVTRYLEKQKIYGRLLDKIAYSQREIEKLKSQRDTFLKLKKQVQDQISQLDMNKKSQLNILQQLHKLSIANQKNIKIQVLNSRLNQWILRQQRKIYISDLKNNKQPSEINKQIKSNFDGYLQWIQQQISSMQSFSDFQANVDLESQKKHTQQIATQLEILQNQIFEQNQLIDNYRGERIKQDQKFFQKLKKQRNQQVLMQIQQEAKLKFKRLDNPVKEEQKKQQTNEKKQINKV